MKNLYKIENELYIISNNENINENNYIITQDGRLVEVSYLLSKDVEGGNKVILTTNKLLIKDGIQAIPDEFLEWFVKNPSCEFVKIEGHIYKGQDETEYKIIIPKEEPKLTNVCVKCGVDLYYATNFTCQEHPKNCKGIYLSKETLLERRAEKKQESEQSIKDKILSETPESVIQKVRETTNELVEPKQRLEKYSERFDNKENEIVQGVFNPENWGRRLVEDKQETLEEAAERLMPKTIISEQGKAIWRLSFEKSAKWQQEQDKNKFSEEEVKLMLWQLGDALFNNCQDGIEEGEAETYFDDIIEQFKKK